IASASGSGLIPICPPSAPTSRTSRARIRSLILGSLLAAGAPISDQSSCIALVLPDASNDGTKRQKAGVDRSTPARSGTRSGWSSTRTHCLLRLRGRVGAEISPRFRCSVVGVGYQSVTHGQQFGAGMSLWPPEGEHRVERESAD